MKVNVLVDKEFKRLLTTAWLRNAAGQVLIEENAKPMVEVGLVITRQDKIQELNRRYLDEDRPTDVLSFPMFETKFDEDCFVSPPDGTLRIGEVIISYPQAKKQAREHGHRVKKEVAILIIHGVLHLLGYDHDTTPHKRVMRKREMDILQVIEEKLL
jgi:probable rRNA maturation factor